MLARPATGRWMVFLIAQYICLQESSCGEVGHISRDCSQAATEVNGINGEPGLVAAPGLQPDSAVLAPVAPAQVAV